MKTHSVESIVKALNDAEVRYLIAGGLAVVAHGYLRFTADVDLILDLEQPNAGKALAALKALGYRPRAPVPMEQFGDPEMRERWIREKGLTVFSLHSTDHPATEIDLFVKSPLDFEQAYRTALQLEVVPGLSATFVGFDDLVKLKEKAGRPQDLADLVRLRESRRGPGL